MDKRQHIKLCADRGFCMGYSIILNPANNVVHKVRAHKLAALKDAQQVANAFNERFDKAACLTAYNGNYNRYESGDG